MSIFIAGFAAKSSVETIVIVTVSPTFAYAVFALFDAIVAVVSVGFWVSISKVVETEIPSTLPATSFAPELITVTVFCSSASLTSKVSVRIVLPTLHAPLPLLVIAPVLPLKAIIGTLAGSIASL